jgi:hypothetical protein
MPVESERPLHGNLITCDTLCAIKPDVGGQPLNFIWLLDIHRKEMVQVISPIQVKSRNIVGPWLPDGQGLYFIYDCYHQNLMLQDLSLKNLWKSGIDKDALYSE